MKDRLFFTKTLFMGGVVMTGILLFCLSIWQSKFGSLPPATVTLLNKELDYNRWWDILPTLVIIGPLLGLVVKLHRMA